MTRFYKHSAPTEQGACAGWCSFQLSAQPQRSLRLLRLILTGSDGSIDESQTIPCKTIIMNGAK